MAAVGADAVAYLAGELPRRDEYQHPASPGHRRPRLGEQPMQDANAAVLPVPVWAIPITSRPDNAIGMACNWMGVGVT